MAEEDQIAASVHDTTPWNAISSPDIVCFLVPRSPVACQCVAHLATEPKPVSKHVLERPPQDEKDDDDEQQPAQAIALRLSSRLTDPLKGFKFGRHPERCDIVFAGNRFLKRDPMVSMEHFRIFLDEATGAPMLQDHSAYGTIVDGELLLPHGDGGPLSRTDEAMEKNEKCRRNAKTLQDGSLITLNLSPVRSVLSFSVRFPLNRTEDTELYQSNLRAYHKRLAALAAEKKNFETAALSKRVWDGWRKKGGFVNWA